jgi:hypothetical protein
MADLSKIDFTKCVLPMWMTMKWDVKFISGITHPIHIRNGIGAIAVRAKSQGSPWRIGTRELTASFDELDQLHEMCAQVDAFIERELKRIAEESLPPWRECELEEAEEFRVKGPEWPLNWLPIAVRVGAYEPSKYEYRTRKPLPKLPTVVLPDGCSFAEHRGVLLYDSRTGVSYRVPTDDRTRDIFLACCAASDEMREKHILTTDDDGLGWRTWSVPPTLRKGRYEVLFRKIG